MTNDFTDRTGSVWVGGGADDSVIGHGAGEGDETLIAEDTEEPLAVLASQGTPYLGERDAGTVHMTHLPVCAPSRLYPDDLPD